MVEGKTLSKDVPNFKNKSHIYYNQNCASCHGKNRNGIFDPNSQKVNEIVKDYIPSLIGLSFDKSNLEKCLI